MTHEEAAISLLEKLTCDLGGDKSPTAMRLDLITKVLESHAKQYAEKFIPAMRQENESLKRIYEELVDSYGRLIDLFWDKPGMREDGQRGYFVKSEEYKRVLRERDVLRIDLKSFKLALENVAQGEFEKNILSTNKTGQQWLASARETLKEYETRIQIERAKDL